MAHPIYSCTADIVLMAKTTNAAHTICTTFSGVRRQQVLCWDTRQISLPGLQPPRGLGTERVWDPVPQDGLAPGDD